ncbi:MAG: hypothetical protein NTZ19_05740 [Bacteroidetes bacterium]|nr:hypothetical protein [Bacteroidota bacterium]
MQNNFIKTALLIIFILLAFNAQSQSSVFVRVYDKSGNKIARGNIVEITDSSLQLEKSNTIILVKNIGYIKTKHSFGHTVLISSAITAGIFATLMAISSSDKGGFLSWTLTEGIAAGLLAGVVYGPIIGGISAIFKNVTTFPINGSEKNWKEFHQYFDSHR